MEKIKRASGIIGGVIGFVEDKCLAASYIIALAMTFFITLDAASRYIFRKPIPGGFEITEEYLMPALFFLAVSAIYVRGGHVRVTMLLKYIPLPVRRFLRFLNTLLSLGFSALVAYGGYIVTGKALHSGEYSNSILAYPMAPAYAFILLGFGLLSIRLLFTVFTLADDRDEGE